MDELNTGTLYNDEEMKSPAFTFIRDPDTKKISCEIKDDQYVELDPREDKWVEYIDASTEMQMRCNPETGDIYHLTGKFFHKDLPGWINCICKDKFDGRLE